MQRYTRLDLLYLEVCIFVGAPKGVPTSYV